MTDNSPELNFIEPRVAAGALFFDEQGRILMVVPTYKDYLDIPGGYVEHGETPSEAVRRELFEELGIKPPIGRLLVADWWTDSPENNNKAKLLLVFDGGILAPSDIDSITLQQDEISEIRFLNADKVTEVTIPRLSNRVTMAIEARAAEHPMYLENGGQPNTTSANSRSMLDHTLRD